MNINIYVTIILLAKHIYFHNIFCFLNITLHDMLNPKLYSAVYFPKKKKSKIIRSGIVRILIWS